MNMTIKSVSVDIICPFCGKTSTLSLNWEDFANWQNGDLIQDAFPYLNASERELLISGICAECWDRNFESEQEDCEDPEDDWDDYPDWNDWDEEEDEEREDFPDDHLWDSYDLEVGFNPYMGCYDYDC